MMRNVARGIVLAIAGALSMTACVVEQVPDHDRVEHVDGQEPLVPVVVVEQCVPMTRGVQTCGWLALSHPMCDFITEDELQSGSYCEDGPDEPCLCRRLQGGVVTQVVGYCIPEVEQ